MKKYILIFMILYTAVITTSCNNNKEQKVIEKTLSGDMDHSKIDHTKMDGDMGSMKMTGDFDVDFANTMILHHQSAIDMAKKVLPNATNYDVKKIAQNIITAQEKEITAFKEILKFNETSSTKNDANASNLLSENMMKMDTEMKAISMTGNAEKDFLTMMIPHHKSAVLMGKDELANGKNNALKEMATKIIADQNNEIKMFEDILLKMK